MGAGRRANPLNCWTASSVAPGRQLLQCPCLGPGKGEGEVSQHQSLLLQLFDQNELFLAGKRKKPHKKTKSPTIEVTPITLAAAEKILRTDNTPGPGLLSFPCPHSPCLPTLHPNTGCCPSILEHCRILFQIRRGWARREAWRSRPGLSPTHPSLAGSLFPQLPNGGNH